MQSWTWGACTSKQYPDADYGDLFYFPLPLADVKPPVPSLQEGGTDGLQVHYHNTSDVACNNNDTMLDLTGLKSLRCMEMSAPQANSLQENHYVAWSF